MESKFQKRSFRCWFFFIVLLVQNNIYYSNNFRYSLLELCIPFRFFFSLSLQTCCNSQTYQLFCRFQVFSYWQYALSSYPPQRQEPWVARRAIQIRRRRTDKVNSFLYDWTLSVLCTIHKKGEDLRQLP